MDSKLERLLNSIGINEDYLDYFKDGFVEKVVVDRDTNAFCFCVRVNEIVPYVVYEDFLSCLKSEFNVLVSLEILYGGSDYSRVREYVNKIISDYCNDSIRYGVFRDRELNISGKRVEFFVYNKIESINMNNISNNVVDRLRKYGFNDIDFSIVLDKKEDEELLSKIESEKNISVPSYVEKKSVVDEGKEKNYYRAKKSKEITKIKDLLYEVDNVNIEAKIFGIDLFEAKSGYKIFTLKVTDGTDSMYCKLFTKDEEEFSRIKGLLKNGSWYQFYGRVKIDNFSGDELVFMTRYRDITLMEDKVEWSRVDNAPLKRVELHAHTMMSQMDGLIDEVKLVRQAIKWGHRAVAITDHDGCQAFPHVFNEVTGHNKKVLAPYKDKLKELKEKRRELEKSDDVCGIKLLDSEIEKVNEEMKNAPTFKALYGTELEMSDDRLNIVVNAPDDDIYNSTYVIFDTETTGFNPGLSDSMIEIGAVKMKDGAVIESFDELINPGHLIDSEITELTGITNSMVRDCPNEEEVVRKFKEWIGDLPLVAHNARFDRDMLEMAYYKYDLGKLNNPMLDTMIISQVINKDLKRHSLSALTKNYGISFSENDEVTGDKHHHRADYDAEFTGYVFFKMLKQLDKDKIKTFKDLENLPNEEEVNKLDRESHINIIVLNRKGLKNMFKLISFASTKYLVKSARIPRRVVNEYREDILVGSGCYNGEVFKTALTRSCEDLKKVMEFYDYVEVQPISNYSHLVARHDIDGIEDVKYAIEKIVKCAREMGKLVVATCDAHTLEKDDKIYREIIVHQNVPGKGRHPLARYLNLKGYETIPDQYFRTTDEMIGEFSFLGEDVALEIVVENTNKIADMCEEIEVIIDTGGIPFSPKIDKSIETVVDLVYTKAKSWYGDNLPYNIEERIAKELYGDSVLNSINDLLKKDGVSEEDFEREAFKRLHEVIISGDDKVRDLVRENIRANCNEELSDDEVEKLLNKNLGGVIGGGFDVIYLIAQKLVKHSNDEGFLVGSRGSVGSSFVATMMGITEVNPLPAHYRCPDCKYSIFNDDEGNALGAVYSSGFDLPDKNCPKCGARMIKDGQDMPFATFLGFNADKVPDIDLNFSDLNQASAHNYTKVLFGVDNVYRAGTIGTVAEKTAFGYVKGFCEDKNVKMRAAEVDRIAAGCTGVKRTTGQHPGGIVVIPGYMDVFDFTPYQYPADDPTSPWRTTHFDYHAIDQDVLKLDILGHTDPTQLRLIQNIRGVNVVDDVPLDDKETMKIFLSPEPLGVTSEQIMCETGTLGIPEFGTGFTISMLVDTKPKTFAELIKISGLSHGTDVWLGNAQDLIRNGTVPFKDVIGCRDDIMVYLMYNGVEPLKAFKIMEFVRKGKASKDPETWKQHVKTMKDAGIQEWFIDSCSKIKYMFPKAHAAAYVISAFRIAYYKVHYPAIYYATYFSTRLTDFDIVTMIRGYDSIKARIIEINNKGYDVTNKETAVLETLKLSLEATARGINFGNLDLMRSDARDFIIDDDGVTLIPPFRTIDGLGDVVAQSICEEAKKHPFISIEEFQKRCRVSNTLVDKMKAMNLFGDLPETSQLSLF